MDQDELARLRSKADGLEPGEAALFAYSDLLDRDLSDSAAAIMVGRSLQALGRNEEAREHWALFAELQPDNLIVASRARETKYRPLRELGGSEGTAMSDAADVRGYYNATTPRMRLFLDELARHPKRRRTNPELESELGWEPLSIRGTAASSNRRVGDIFDGRLPYHWADAPDSESGRFETWMDADQAAAILSLAGGAD